MTNVFRILARRYDEQDGSWSIEAHDSEGKVVGEAKYHDILSQDDRKDILWYLEDFAYSEVFAVERSYTAAQLLVNAGRSLAAVVEELLTSGGVLDDSTSLRLVVVDTGAKNSLFTLCWELLEDPQLWTRKKWKSITVSRAVGCQSLPPVIEAAPLNILLLSARPDKSVDIQYRLISKPIWHLIHRSQFPSSRARLTLVRPGTWSNFKAELEARGNGYYGLVHLDMHGVIRKGKAQLQFNPQYYYQSRPISKSAEDVGDLLCASGVRIVILNACDSANASQGLSSNLAQTFATRGVPNIVAMSSKVSAETASMFMQELYTRLLTTECELGTAVQQARDQLRQIQRRSAISGSKVTVRDSTIPVMYQNHYHQGFFRLQVTAGTVLPSVGNWWSQILYPVGKPSLPLSRSLIASQNHNCDIDHLNFVGRDADLLAIEAAVSECRLVQVIGTPGIGKSAFAAQIHSWWEQTRFVEYIFRVDFARIDQDWNEDTLYHKMLDVMEKNISLSEIHSVNFLLIVDNFEFGYLWNFVQDRIQRLMEPFAAEPLASRQSKLVYFSSSEMSLPEFRPMRRHFLLPLPPLETAMVAKDRLALGDINFFQVPDDKAARELATKSFKTLLRRHDNNLLFLEMFWRLFTYRSYLGQPEKIHDGFQSGLPPGAKGDMNRFGIQALDQSAAPSTKGLFAPPCQVFPSNTILCFGKFCEAVRRQRPFEYFLLLSLAPFQRFMLVPWRSWIFRLHKQGAIDAAGSPFSSSRAVGGTNLDNVDEDTFFEANPSMLSDAEDLFSALSLCGLAEVMEAPETSQPRYLRLHPLLPYLLRLWPEISDPPTRVPDYFVPFKEHCENLAKNMVQWFHTIPENDWLVEMRFKESLNMRVATRMWLQDPGFYTRKLFLIDVMCWDYSEAHPSDSKTDDISLLREVLDTLELLWADGDPKAASLPADLQSHHLERALGTAMAIEAFCERLRLSNTSDRTLSPGQVARRGIEIFRRASDITNPTEATNIYYFCLRCRAAMGGDDQNPVVRAEIRDLLHTSPPRLTVAFLGVQYLAAILHLFVYCLMAKVYTFTSIEFRSALKQVKQSWQTFEEDVVRDEPIRSQIVLKSQRETSLVLRVLLDAVDEEQESFDTVMAFRLIERSQSHLTGEAEVLYLRYTLPEGRLGKLSQEQECLRLLRQARMADNVRMQIICLETLRELAQCAMDYEAAHMFAEQLADLQPENEVAQNLAAPGARALFAALRQNGLLHDFRERS